MAARIHDLEVAATVGGVDLGGLMRAVGLLKGLVAGFEDEASASEAQVTEMLEKMCKMMFDKMCELWAFLKGRIGRSVVRMCPL